MVVLMFYMLATYASLSMVLASGKLGLGWTPIRESVKKKGPNRPYNNLDDRVEFISSIKYVSSVVTFDSDNELIQRIIEFKPDYMVIGDDYNRETIIGIEHIPEVMFFNKIRGKSTSSILGYDSNSSR